MKKQLNLKRVISLTLVLIMVFVACAMFSSCGVSKGDIVGKWKHEKGWSTTVIIFYEDGEYYLSTAKVSLTGSGSSLGTTVDTVDSQSGTYQIKGNEVRCSPNNSYETYIYKYADGKLTCGEVTYTKYE